MYQNPISLIGFLGNDATTRSANNASFTVLSLATKSSYKDKKTGEYNGHTEWHRCVVWGRLSEYANAHQGHARRRGRRVAQPRARGQKDDARQRVWEVRLASILKLDRAEKASPEESQDMPEEVPE